MVGSFLRVTVHSFILHFAAGRLFPPPAGRIEHPIFTPARGRESIIPFFVFSALLLAGLGFQHSFGLLERRQPRLAEPQLLGQLITPVACAIQGVFFGIDRLSPGQ